MHIPVVKPIHSYGRWVYDLTDLSTHALAVGIVLLPCVLRPVCDCHRGGLRLHRATPVADDQHTAVLVGHRNPAPGSTGSLDPYRCDSRLFDHSANSR